MSLSPNAFEVWLCHFRFLDKPDVKKVRPAIILEASDEELIAIMIKITSHNPRENVSGEIVIEDLDVAGLLKQSTIRCSQIVELPYDDLIRRIGRLSDNDKHNVMQALIKQGYIES